MKRQRSSLASTILLLVLVAACASPPPTPLQPVATTKPTSTPPEPVSTGIPTPTPATSPGLHMGQITSQALANNLLGDPATRPYFVYLPPGYDTSDKHYPVVYVLHWYTGTFVTFARLTMRSMDALIADNKVKPMILIFPDADNKLGGSMYRSSPTIGDYETYITKELVNQIDATYRTLTGRESRGVMGCSMGGMGTLHLAFKYPDVFSVAAPMSAVYDWEHNSDWEAARSGFSIDPQNMAEFWSLDFETQFYIAAAAATAPNPDKPPFYLDMPFELVNGTAQTLPEIFRKVNTLDPMNDVARYLDQPIRLRGLLVYQDTALGYPPDEVALYLTGVHGFIENLANLGIPHEYAEVDAPHCEFDFSPILEFMGANLAY